MAQRRIRLTVEEARELSEGALTGIGYQTDEARVIADHVVDAALCGYEYSGLPKLLNVMESPRFRLPRRAMSVLHETDVSVSFDGGNNVGMLVLYHAAKAAIAKAAARGFALVAVTNAWMSGRSAYYVEMIANADLVAIHTAGAGPAVAPPGGTRPVLGTNPIAFGIPGRHAPVVFDMGTSAIMMSDVMLRARLGEPLPEQVAIGPGGEPTCDAAAARLGALLPFGGYKGFGLALVAQAFALLARPGADGSSESGYLFVVFRPDLLGSLDDFKRDVTDLVDRLKATPRQPGVDAIRIPSERAFRNRSEAMRQGIEIDRPIYDALAALRAKAA